MRNTLISLIGLSILLWGGWVLVRVELQSAGTGEAYAGGLRERGFLLGDPGGVRSKVSGKGVRVEGQVTADYSRVFDGGADPGGSVFRTLFEAGLSLETEPLVGLRGGMLLIRFVNQNGRDGSESVGDFQVYSNIDEANFTAIYEWFYEQELLDGRLRIKVGKVDANEEFAYVEHGGEFIHSSPGFSPTIQSFPSYPDPATSVNVFVVPSDTMYAAFGLYDGALQEGIATGRRGPSTFFGEPDDLFLIAEAGMTYGEDWRPGRVGAGVWRHTGTFERFDGGREGSASGYYIVFDQVLYRHNPSDPDDAREVGMFAQYGWADPRVSEVEHHVGMGAQWTGPFPRRDADVAGVMASYVHFSDKPGSAFIEAGELAIEVFYKAQITPWFGFKPDLQFIANPGGQELPDAWVGTLRAELAF